MCKIRTKLNLHVQHKFRDVSLNMIFVLRGSVNGEERRVTDKLVTPCSGENFSNKVIACRNFQDCSNLHITANVAPSVHPLADFVCMLHRANVT